MGKQVDLMNIQRIETYILKRTVEILEKNNIGYSMYAGSVLGTIRHNGPIPWDSDIDIIVSIEDLEKVEQVLDEQLEQPLYVDYYPKNKKYNYFYPRVGIKGADLYRVHVDVFLYSALPSDTEERHLYFLEARKKLVEYHHKSDIKFTRAGIIENIWRTAYHFIRSASIKESKEHLYYQFMDFSNRYNLDDETYTSELGCNRYGEKMVFDKKYWKKTVYHNYDGIQVKIPEDYDDFLKQMYGNYMQYPSIEEQNKAKHLKFILEDNLYEWCLNRGILH